jgi:hypothetical protein
MNPPRLFKPLLVLGCLAGAVVGCGSVVGLAQFVSPVRKPAAAMHVRVVPPAPVGRSGWIPVASAAPAAAGPCHLAQRPTRALDTVTLFVATAVQRLHTGLSYELVAPAMRAGFSCARWQAGTIPVIPIQAIDWGSGIPYRVVARSPASVSLLLRIRSLLPSFGTHLFRITTVQLRGRWFVSYFMSADPAWTPA